MYSKYGKTPDNQFNDSNKDVEHQSTNEHNFQKGTQSEEEESEIEFTQEAIENFFTNFDAQVERLSRKESSKEEIISEEEERYEQSSDSSSPETAIKIEDSRESHQKYNTDSLYEKPSNYCFDKELREEMERRSESSEDEIPPFHDFEKSSTEDSSNCPQPSEPQEYSEEFAVEEENSEEIEVNKFKRYHKVFPSHYNIVLLGCSGIGKTTIFNKLAPKMVKYFPNIDVEIIPHFASYPEGREMLERYLKREVNIHGLKTFMIRFYKQYLSESSKDQRPLIRIFDGSIDEVFYNLLHLREPNSTICDYLMLSFILDMNDTFDEFPMYIVNRPKNSEECEILSEQGKYYMNDILSYINEDMCNVTAGIFHGEFTRFIHLHAYKSSILVERFREKDPELEVMTKEEIKAMYEKDMQMHYGVARLQQLKFREYMLENLKPNSSLNILPPHPKQLT
jgi:DNA replication protein DnaC